MERLIGRWKRATNSSHGAPSLDSAQARSNSSTDIDESWGKETSTLQWVGIYHENRRDARILLSSKTEVTPREMTQDEDLVDVSAQSANPRTKSSTICSELFPDWYAVR